MIFVAVCYYVESEETLPRKLKESKKIMSFQSFVLSGS
jgi:hypothetical protein